MRQKILLIDDSIDMRVLMRMLLESEGYEIDEACDGKQALLKIDKEKSPDLIFLDHNMPVMDGPAFVKAFERKHPKLFSTTPVIMLTGRDTDDVSKTHATEVINKQHGIDDLIKLTAKYLLKKPSKNEKKTRHEK